MIRTMVYDNGSERRYYRGEHIPSEDVLIITEASNDGIDFRPYPYGRFQYRGNYQLVPLKESGFKRFLSKQGL